MKILAVDDDPIILELLREAVTAAGYTEVETAPGGPEALDLIAQSEDGFDCFLLDIQMPEMDGIELCQKIRSMRRHAESPILMITAMSEKEYVDRAFVAGATDYVTKPFDILELMTRIRIAERLVREQALIEEKEFAIDALKNHVATQKTVDLRDEIFLSGVPGAIQKLAFENYVLQLGRSGLFGSAFIAFRITNAQQIHDHASPSEFTHTILDVGDVIADALKSTEYFLCYRGSGVYAAVAKVGTGATFSNMREQIETDLADLDLCLANGAQLGVDMVIGEPVQCGLFQSSGTLEPLWQALEQVDGTDRALARGTAAEGIKKRMKRITDQIIQTAAL